MSYRCSCFNRDCKIMQLFHMLLLGECFTPHYSTPRNKGNGAKFRWKHPQRRHVVILCHSSCLDALHHDSHVSAAPLSCDSQFWILLISVAPVNQSAWNNSTGITGCLYSWLQSGPGAASFANYLSNPPVICLWAQIHPLLHTPAISYHWHWTLLPQFQFTLQYHKKEMENVSFPDQHLNALDYKTVCPELKNSLTLPWFPVERKGKGILNHWSFLEV